MKNNITEIFKYKEIVPGIKSALELIENFNYVIKDVEKGNDSKYYNYFDGKESYYEFVDFNAKFQEIFSTEIVFRKIIAHNELYTKLSNLYDGRYLKYNFKYRNNLFNSHTLLSMFIKNLRHNYDGTFIFSMKNIFDFLKSQIFSEEVSAENQCSFILAYIFDLEDNKIIKYDYVNNFIKFEIEYQQDLLNLMFCSLDPIIVGKKQMYKTINTKELINYFNIEKMVGEYSGYPPIKKLIINDLLLNLALSQCTDFVSFGFDTNNLILDYLEERILFK